MLQQVVGEFVVDIVQCGLVEAAAQADQGAAVAGHGMTEIFGPREPRIQFCSIQIGGLGRRPDGRHAGFRVAGLRERVYGLDGVFDIAGDGRHPLGAHGGHCTVASPQGAGDNAFAGTGAVCFLAQTHMDQGRQSVGFTGRLGQVRYSVCQTTHGGVWAVAFVGTSGVGRPTLERNADACARQCTGRDQHLPQWRAWNIVDGVGCSDLCVGKAGVCQATLHAGAVFFAWLEQSDDGRVAGPPIRQGACQHRHMAIMAAAMARPVRSGQSIQIGAKQNCRAIPQASQQTMPSDAGLDRDVMGFQELLHDMGGLLLGAADLCRGR